jgi:hypothetical protein
MYRFHYDKIVGCYGAEATLLFTDTDSLCYHIKTDDIYADMKENWSAYDTSGYPRDHPSFSEANANVVGKFNDECGGVEPLEFVGLRAKMYSLLVSKTTKPKMTAKGVNRSFVAKNVKHSDFLQTLETQITTSATLRRIRSTNHELQTVVFT